jgi:hypothetical protein
MIADSQLERLMRQGMQSQENARRTIAWSERIAKQNKAIREQTQESLDRWHAFRPPQQS